MSRRFTYQEMQPQELRRALKELGLTPSQFARISGTREDRFEQMLRGTRNIPQAIRMIAVLLKMPGAIALADAVTASVVTEEKDEPDAPGGEPQAAAAPRERTEPPPRAKRPPTAEPFRPIEAGDAPKAPSRAKRPLAAEPVRSVPDDAPKDPPRPKRTLVRTRAQ